MHYELQITHKNTDFTVKVNYDIIAYLTQLNPEEWFSITFTNEQITDLKTLAKTDEEIRFTNFLTENTPVDIFRHFYF